MCREYEQEVEIAGQVSDRRGRVCVTTAVTGLDTHYVWEWEQTGRERAYLDHPALTLQMSLQQFTLSTLEMEPCGRIRLIFYCHSLYWHHQLELQ